MKEITLNVKNMHCKSCEMLITDALKELEVKSKADSDKDIVKVSFDEIKITEKEIKTAIKKAGFEVE